MARNAKLKCLGHRVLKLWEGPEVTELPLCLGKALAWSLPWQKYTWELLLSLTCAHVLASLAPICSDSILNLIASFQDFFHHSLVKESSKIKASAILLLRAQCLAFILATRQISYGLVWWCFCFYCFSFPHLPLAQETTTKARCLHRFLSKYLTLYWSSCFWGQQSMSTKPYRPPSHTSQLCSWLSYFFAICLGTTLPSISTLISLQGFWQSNLFQTGPTSTCTLKTTG